MSQSKYEEAGSGTAPGASPVDLSREKVLYVVTTSHLDTQWRWTIQDTIRDLVPATLRGNFAHFEKHPNYVFSFEGAYRYMLAKEYYPRDYDRLKQYVAQGRWRVCGSFVDACDVNVPSPESLIRHILYGNGFFKREFGKTSCDVFLPDCFGFGYALPSIAVHCGLKGFSTQKLTWGSSVSIPFNVGVWEGVDGSSLVAAVNPGEYISKLDHDLAKDEYWIRTVEEQGSKSGVYVGYKYIGVGDQGGAVSDETVSWLERSIASGGPIRVISAGADQLFRDITDEQAARLPRYKGELLMTAHGAGCYTSQAAMKRWNRKNELLADAAERASVAAEWLGALPYPADKLYDAWIRVLWHQFHDDLTGTSIPQAYVFSWNDEIVALNQFAEVLKGAVGGVAKGLDTRVQGVPVVVYNPLSTARADVADARITFPDGAPSWVRVFDADGNEVPSQVVEADERSVRVLFQADVPAVGFRVYDVRPSEGPCEVETGVAVTENSIENERYRVQLDGNGDVASIWDKQVERELLSAPIRLELYKHHVNDWPAWEIHHKDLTEPPYAVVGGPAEVRAVECGPVRAGLEVVRHAAGSTFVQRIQLCVGDSGDRVDFDTSIEWKTKETFLKAVFRLAASNPNATYDLGLGTIERGVNTERKHEVPAQQWADITSEDNSFGVALMNDCRYGWDKPDDRTLRLTLLLTPATKDGWLEDQRTQDIGHHRVVYSLCGHSGDWRDGRVQWSAARLNQPLLTFQTVPSAGALGRAFSLLSVDTPQVAVKAVKRSEDGQWVVLRLQELWGRSAEGVSVALCAPIVRAVEANGAEEPLGELTLENGRLALNLKPYQPRTVMLKLADPATQVGVPECLPVRLPYDASVVSTDEDTSAGDFDGAGHSLPAELFPGELVSEGILFRMGPTSPGQPNAVVCRGQEIALDADGWSDVYVLAASASEDVPAVFRIDGKPYELLVQSFTGLVGQWDSRVVDGEVVREVEKIKPGFIKRAPIAWVGTHRHSASEGNEPHVLCYLFKYRLAIPGGKAEVLTLPNNEAVRVLAVTLARNTNDDTVPAVTLYD
ncbi:MAG: alpha-mannosidase [Armatimonadota bacterium]